MKITEKICNGCDQLRYIWKNSGGKRYCKSCWGRHSAKIKERKVPKVQAPIPSRSSKQIKLDALYRIARNVYLRDSPMCKAHLTDCTEYATEVHHKAGRGEYLLDTSTWLAVCRNCHNYIENNPKLAKALGFSVERLKTTKNEKTNNEI